MYIGRIVGVAMTSKGALCALYRVSSRSFPNRTAIVGDDKVSIVPKQGCESDIQKNPYIAYNCVRVACHGAVVVATNGSQTDPIAEKIDMGMPPRDAMALASLALDYEKDQYNTPRISAVVDDREGAAWLSTVREDGIEVKRVPLSRGKFFYLATYEENGVSLEQGGDFPAGSAAEACDFLLCGGVFAGRTHPVTGIAAVVSVDGVTMHALDVA